MLMVSVITTNVTSAIDVFINVSLNVAKLALVVTKSLMPVHSLVILPIISTCECVSVCTRIGNRSDIKFLPQNFHEPHGRKPVERTDSTVVGQNLEFTGRECHREEEVVIFVAGVGTGGTVTGTSRYLKEQDPNIQTVAIEPAASPLLTQGKAGPHGLQGIGANFVPEILDRTVIDDILTVTEEEAFSAARLLARKEGILCGISSGAALHGAIKLAKDEKNAGKTIVVLLPDSGERYLSTNLFA